MSATRTKVNRETIAMFNHFRDQWATMENELLDAVRVRTNGGLAHLVGVLKEESEWRIEGRHLAGEQDLARDLAAASLSRVNWRAVAQRLVRWAKHQQRKAVAA